MRDLAGRVAALGRDLRSRLQLRRDAVAGYLTVTALYAVLCAVLSATAVDALDDGMRVTLTGAVISGVLTYLTLAVAGLGLVMDRATVPLPLWWRAVDVRTRVVGVVVVTSAAGAGLCALSGVLLPGGAARAASLLALLLLVYAVGSSFTLVWRATPQVIGTDGLGNLVTDLATGSRKRLLLRKVALATERLRASDDDLEVRKVLKVLRTAVRTGLRALDETHARERADHVVMLAATLDRFSPAPDGSLTGLLSDDVADTSARARSVSLLLSRTVVVQLERGSDDHSTTHLLGEICRFAVADDPTLTDQGAGRAAGRSELDVAIRVQLAKLRGSDHTMVGIASRCVARAVEAVVARVMPPAEEAARLTRASGLAVALLRWDAGRDAEVGSRLVRVLLTIAERLGQLGDSSPGDARGLTVYPLLSTMSLQRWHSGAAAAAPPELARLAMVTLPLTLQHDSVEDRAVQVALALSAPREELLTYLDTERKVVLGPVLRHLVTVAEASEPDQERLAAALRLAALAFPASSPEKSLSRCDITVRSLTGVRNADELLQRMYDHLVLEGAPALDRWVLSLLRFHLCLIRGQHFPRILSERSGYPAISATTWDALQNVMEGWRDHQAVSHQLGQAIDASRRAALRCWSAGTLNGHTSTPAVLAVAARLEAEAGRTATTNSTLPSLLARIPLPRRPYLDLVGFDEARSAVGLPPVRDVVPEV